MSKSNNPRRHTRAWHPFVEVPAIAGITHFRNNLYNVVIREHGPVTHLTITPLDGRVSIQNPMEIQRIKNELAGKDREGVQIFPAANRREYAPGALHLWVLKPPLELPRALTLAADWYWLQ